MPAPVVVDANVLIRNVEYAIKNKRAGALFGQASKDYSLFTGIVLFAAAEVHDEALRHLLDVAARRDVSLDQVHVVWNKLILPNVRFVDLDPGVVDDPRVEAVRQLDAPDVHSAALVALLAPAILMTDNRKHFRPFGLPSFGEVNTDRVAIDLFGVGEYGLGVRGTLAVPALAGSVTVEGSRKVISKVGGDWAAVIGLLVLGAAVLFLTSERTRGLRAQVGDVARQVGPPLLELLERYTAASEGVGALAVEPEGERGALGIVARRLAISRPVMTTQEIVAELRNRGLRFDAPGRFETKTRAWLLLNSCFVEHQRGHWTLGYHAAET